ELDEEQREYLTLVKSSANALLSIINDILRLLEDPGKSSFDFEHIGHSLRDCVAWPSEPFSNGPPKDLLLSVQVAPEAPDSLVGDPHRLRRV
ncbi:MAG: hybrid sensor histidine kinase/response regulator, partial [Zoogloea sp.]|nr:hybrid sensor histidine kinase/response regulator [Zoogloea sp.]